METSIFHSRRRRLFMSSQPLRFRGNAMPTAMAPATWAACSRLPCEGAQQNFRCTDWSTKIPRMDSDNPQYTSMYWIYNIISYNHLVCNHQPTGVLSTAQICFFFKSLIFFHSHVLNWATLYKNGQRQLSSHHSKCKAWKLQLCPEAMQGKVK